MSDKSLIHATAIIDPSAELATDVRVGPYTVIGPDVKIGQGCEIGPHVVINGPTEIGAHNRIFQFASVGEECQDKKYKGEPTKLIVGDHNVIRESVTIHRGTTQDNSETVVGNNNLLMAYVHVAHDCVVGNNIILANNASLAGHVKVSDGAILGGFSGVHQFCHIGAYCMSGMFSVITKDVPAFVTVQGNLAKPHGMNTEGMRRRGYTQEHVQVLKRAYKVVYRQGLTLEEASAAIDEMIKSVKTEGEVDQLVVPQVCDDLSCFKNSLSGSNRGIVR